MDLPICKLEEVEKPTPSDNEVLVKVRDAALNAGDWHVMRGELLHCLVGTGLLTPKQKMLRDESPVKTNNALNGA